MCIIGIVVTSFAQKATCDYISEAAWDSIEPREFGQILKRNFQQAAKEQRMPGSTEEEVEQRRLYNEEALSYLSALRVGFG